MTWDQRIKVHEFAGKFRGSVTHRMVWDVVVHVTEPRETELEAGMLAKLWILAHEHLNEETYEALKKIL